MLKESRTALSWGMEELEVKVSKNARLKKSAKWRLDGDTILLEVPTKWTRAQISAISAQATGAAVKARAKSAALASDAYLAGRVAHLRRTFNPSLPDGLVMWSDKELASRWGYCAGDGTIVISAQVRTMPEYVIDAILVHELAHRALPGHGHDAQFWNLVKSFADYEKASAFLDGANWARGLDQADW